MKWEKKKNAKDEERMNEGRKSGCLLSPENIVMLPSPPFLSKVSFDQLFDGAAAMYTLYTIRITHLLAMRSCLQIIKREPKKKEFS